MALGLHIGLWTSALNSGNLSPRILTSNAVPVNESTQSGDAVASLSIGNPADGQTYGSWTLLDDYDGAFAINATTGAVTAGADLRRAGSASMSFRAQATESPSGNLIQRTVTLTQEMSEPVFPLLSALPNNVRLEKLRADYYEFAAYTPINENGIDWARNLFSTRLNTGNAGAPRLLRSSVANLYAQTPVAQLLENLEADANEIDTVVSRATSDATARVGTWTSATTQSGLVTDSRYTSTVGDYVEYEITGVERIYLRCYINAAVGGNSTISVKENSVEIPAANKYPDGDLVVQDPRTGIAWIPLAGGLDSSLTYTVRLTLDASSDSGDRLYDAGLVGSLEVVFDDIGRHGMIYDQAIGTPLVTYMRLRYPGTVMVYECLNCSRIVYNYFQAPSVGKFRLTVYNAAGSEVATSTVDGYGGSTHLSVIAASGLTLGTHYLHVELLNDSNVSATEISMFGGSVIAIDESTAGTFGADVFATNGIVDAQSQIEPVTLQGTGNLEYAVKANKPENDPEVSIDFLGGIHGHETTPVSLGVSVDGVDVTAAYAAAAAGEAWDGQEIVITYQSTLTFVDGGNCATIDGIVTINRGGITFDHTRTLLTDSRVVLEYAMMVQAPEGSGTEGSYGGGFEKCVSASTGDLMRATDDSDTRVPTKSLSNRAVLFNNSAAISLELLNPSECDAAVSAYNATTPISFLQDRADKSKKFYRQVGAYGDGVVLPSGHTVRYSRLMRIATI